ncbi:RNA methyltransferase [Portibacter marinus]|uniref:RNA methyltransferase n=1 Tax=Portibacter marinus TaxID=2898660 RepID=UPI001F265C92|nr:RNA methyltransferase [Portibacter marinus]
MEQKHNDHALGNVRKLKLEELGRVGVDQFKQLEKLPVTILVDNFRSGLNVGSVFRTSDAFLVEKVILCGISSTPPHKKILKTAIGANRSVEWEYVEDISEAVHSQKSMGYTIIGIEQTTASKNLASYNIDKERKYAIIFGNEVEGLSKKILPMVDTFLEIPQFGTKHSLNVSVCAGIVIYQFALALST